jgi:hypothetical protein
MSRDLASPVKHLLIAGAVAIVLIGCTLPADRDARAFANCIGRHPQEAALCEGPRQAYEVDTATYQARAAAINPPTGAGYEERSAAPRPALVSVPLRPNPTPATAGPNG